MKPYGLNRREIGDDDAGGCSAHGRATGIYSVSKNGADMHSYRALRGGRKAAVRRIFKRRERTNAKRAIARGEF